MREFVREDKIEAFRGIPREREIQPDCPRRGRATPPAGAHEANADAARRPADRPLEGRQALLHALGERPLIKAKQERPPRGVVCPLAAREQKQ